jgi:putative flippase GtrA
MAMPPKKNTPLGTIIPAWLWEFFKFAFVGSISTSATYGCFYCCHRFLGLHYSVAHGLGFLVGVALGYILNKVWTFHKMGNTLRYGALYGLSLGISLIVLRFLVENYGLEPTWASLIALCATTLLNFMGLKFWVFKNNQSVF